MTDQAAIAADEAVERMRQLRTQVTRQRAENAEQFDQAREQNQQASDKAIADGRAQRDGRVASRPAQPLPEESFTFLDTEDEYSCQPRSLPSFTMPDVPPPPRPTPRRSPRPVLDDEDDDYSDHNWME